MNTINNYNNSQVQFQGIFGARRLSYAKRSVAIRSAHMLSMPEKDVIDIARKTSDKKWNFFNHLASKFNGVNYYRAEAEKENPELVKEIFDLVKKPHLEHFSFVSQYEGSLDNVKRIFKSAKNDKKRLRFAMRINRDIHVNNPKSNPNIIFELLESPNSKEYVNHYDKYKAYLELNSENKDVVQSLDNLVSHNTFNDNIDSVNLGLLKKAFPYEDTENFNRDIYANNLSNSKGSIIRTFQDISLVDNKMLQNGGDKYLNEIFLSTNPKNLKSRTKLIWCYNEGAMMSTPEKVSQLGMLNNVFKKMDNDKHISNFVNHLLQALDSSMLSLEELDAITNKIPALKLDILKKNAMRIIYNSKDGSRVEILEHELENPFYESHNTRVNRKIAEKYGFRKRRSFLSKAITRVQNQFRILEYKLRAINNNSVVAQNEINPVEIKPIEITPIKVAPEKITPEAVATNTATKETAIVEGCKKPEIKEEIKPLEDKKAKRVAAKAKVQQNIFDIIGSKLGLKTLEKQREVFGTNATKIRLNLLPEIFASITDTRKADRAVGKFKINSSNKDALDLYLLINGSNRKYINYMLKKRNTDNTRMFEVKDIIASVRKAEAKIAADKKANPDYRANDARKYYNHLFEAKLQQYGKIKRPAKQVNTKA